MSEEAWTAVAAIVGVCVGWVISGFLIIAWENRRRR